MAIVTAYDTLGEEGLRHSMLQTNAKVMFTDPELLPKLINPMKEAKDVQVVVYCTKNDAKQKDIDALTKAHPHLKVISFEELVKMGEQNLPPAVHLSSKGIGRERRWIRFERVQNLCITLHTGVTMLVCLWMSVGKLWHLLAQDGEDVRLFDRVVDLQMLVERHGDVYELSLIQPEGCGPVGKEIYIVKGGPEPRVVSLHADRELVPYALIRLGAHAVVGSAQ